MNINSILPARFRQRQVARTLGYHPRGVQPRLERSHLVKGARSAVVVLAIMVVAFGAHKALCRSVLFQITTISIEGCRHLARERILALSGVDNRSNLLALQPAGIRAAIEADPWVEKAMIERRWPNQLIITIAEKKPLALLNCKDGNLYYLDHNGVPIAMAEPGDDLDFPVITGVIPPAPAAPLPAAGPIPVTPRTEPDPVSPLQEALDFLRLASNPKSNSNSILPCQNISEIHLTESGGLILYLLDQAFPIHLGKNDMRGKYNRLVKVLKGLYKKGEIAQTAYIRVDYRPDEVLVGMSKSGGRNKG